jgi:hypothetical protein
VQPEGLGKLKLKLKKFIHLNGSRTHDLLACSAVRQPLHYCAPPRKGNNSMHIYIRENLLRVSLVYHTVFLMYTTTLVTITSLTWFCTIYLTVYSLHEADEEYDSLTYNRTEDHQHFRGICHLHIQR